MAEKIQIDYLQNTVYDVDDSNIIGATTDLTKRTVTAHNDANTKYVRKFGVDYLITQVTDIEDPIDANMTFTVKALDGTTLGSRVGGGAFSAGATVTAQGCYLEIAASGGAVTVLTGITIDTDVDAGGLAFVCAAESVANGDTLTLYLSDTTSTYYDSNYMYGGDRHTPTGLTRLPYFHPTDAISALGGAFTIVTVLDSESYEADETGFGGAYKLQVVLGQTASLINGFGRRVSRETEHEGNNTDTIYVSIDIGSDTTGDGTYQLPYATIQYAHDNLSGRAWVSVMDSSRYTGALILSNAVSIEPLYAKLPDISGSATNMIEFTHINVDIYGFYISCNGGKNGILNSINNFVGDIKDNTFENNLFGILSDSTELMSSLISKNKCINNAVGIFMACDDWDGTLNKNLCSGNSNAGIIAQATDIVGTVSNNVCFGNTSSGININNNNDFQGTVSNNICAGNSDVGLRFDTTIMSGSITGNNCYGNTGNDIEKTGAAATYSFGNYGTNSGFTIAGNSINVNPIFGSSANNKYGLCLNSGALKTDQASDDMGAHLRILNIDNNGVEINGFIFDGLDYYNNAIYGDDAITDLALQWNTINNFNGKAVDLYSTADTNAVSNNNIFYNNGDGLSFTYGGNSASESIFYLNKQAGVYSDYTAQAYTNNVYYSNNYGLYIDSNSSLIEIVNIITSGNSTNGIYTEISISTNYSCINDAIDKSKVSVTSDNNNIIDDPLFRDTTDNPDGFHLKSKASGDFYNSPCLDAADDGGDMGAYLETRGISDYSWKKLVLGYNPRKLNELLQLNKPKKNRDSQGNSFPVTDSDSISFPFEYKEAQLTDEIDYETLRFFQTRVQSRNNNLKRADVIFRLWLLPDSNIISGTGTIDTSAETLTDSAGAYRYDRHKNFWMGIKFEELTSVTVNDTGKTILKTGAGWTTDQWQNYLVKYDGYTLLVFSNTADTLIVSDPDDVLVSGTWTGHIEYYFRVTANTPTVFTLDDRDSKLLETNYGYYIGFVRCVVTSNKFQGTQPHFNYAMNDWKTGYKIFFESITD